MDSSSSGRLELSISDHSQLRSLQEYLSSAAPSIQLLRVAGQTGTGEQGALDLLAVLASSSGLIATIKILPDFLRSRKSAMSITIKVKGQLLTLTVTNTDEMLPILERLLDG